MSSLYCELLCVWLFHPCNCHSQSVPRQDETEISIHISLHLRGTSRTEDMLSLVKLSDCKKMENYCSTHFTQVICETTGGRFLLGFADHNPALVRFASVWPNSEDEAGGTGSHFGHYSQISIYISSVERCHPAFRASGHA